MAVPVSFAAALGLSLFAPVAAQPASDGVIYLDQAWSQADRETYYQMSQGGQMIDYRIFLNLEAADSQELFRSDANSERYGLITQGPNAVTGNAPWGKVPAR